MVSGKAAFNLAMRSKAASTCRQHMQTEMMLVVYLLQHACPGLSERATVTSSLPVVGLPAALL